MCGRPRQLTVLDPIYTNPFSPVLSVGHCIINSPSLPPCSSTLCLPTALLPPPSTRYDPLKKHLFSKDADSSVQRRVGIVGLGGLGVMGARIAKAKGCSVTCISRSAEKKSLSDSCGTDVFLVSTDPAQMQAECGTLDLILNTIPLYHDYIQYQKLLAPGGKQVILGLHKGLPGAMVANGVLCGASKVTASSIGGIINTTSVLRSLSSRPTRSMRCIQNWTAITTLGCAT